MRRSSTGFAALTVWALAWTGGVPAAEPPVTGIEDERTLIAILESDGPADRKAMACKRLAVFGSAESVPALSPLLADKRLASWARIALEVIPGSEADDALREKLDTVEGRLLIGVINSVGVRRDAGSVGALAKLLSHENEAVVEAAAVALGRIGNDAARQALLPALADGQPPAVRSAAARGNLLAAERLLEEGQAEQAAALYDRVRQAEVPRQRLLEATRGVILARQDAGVDVLVDQLRAAEPDRFALALRVAREMPSEKVTAALARELPSAEPARQSLLVIALSRRQDASVLPLLLQSARRGPRPVRLVALEVLPRAGDARCVAPLLELATSDDAELADAAQQALARLPAGEVDSQLRKRLEGARGSLRRVLLEQVGLRRIDAVPMLLEAASASDPQIRHAALSALGATARPDDLQSLIDRAVSADHAEDAAVVQAALRAACVRMPDRDAVCGQLVAALPAAPLEAQCQLLETIARVGGEAALGAMAMAAHDQQPRIRDTASRLLGTWMTADAAPVLLELARSSEDSKYQIRALRGYLRIARQFKLPPEQRVVMCQEALELTRRDAERQLVLEVLARYPSQQSLQLAREMTRFSEIRESAEKTARTIEQKLKK